MGQRMFVAIRPEQEAVEDLRRFLEPRDQHPWIDSRQWHLTLAFLASVPEHRTDELVEALQQRMRRRPPMRLRLTGAGAFPEPGRASVLWMGVAGDREALTETAHAVRRTSNHHGATPDGQTFHPHLTVSRLRRTQDQRRWVQVLDTYEGPEWIAHDVALVASHLGTGHNRPRHETVAVAPLEGEEDAHGSTR